MQVSKGYFITGTDTGVGKTHISVSLVQALREQGKTVAVMKPIASGGSYESGELRNKDAELLIQASGLDIPYELVNPYVFEVPVAPHIAALENNVDISISYIIDVFQQLTKVADVVVVEGAGGWLVPLYVAADSTNKHKTMADLATQLKLPVILVVGMHLGCINHALLTAQSIQESKVKFHGWIANTVEEEMLRYDENINTLKAMISSPLLAEISFSATDINLMNILKRKSA